MKVKEWMKQNPNTPCTMVWAADSHGGFGKKGWGVYGNSEVTHELEVVRTVMSNGHATLECWNYDWGDPYATEPRIDHIFRSYGEEFFGKAAMDRITSAQVEEARCWAMQELHDLTEKYGKQEAGTARELFCNYVFDEFM